MGTSWDSKTSSAAGATVHLTNLPPLSFPQEKRPTRFSESCFLNVYEEVDLKSLRVGGGGQKMPYPDPLQ